MILQVYLFSLFLIYFLEVYYAVNCNQRAMNEDRIMSKLNHIKNNQRQIERHYLQYIKNITKYISRNCIKDIENDKNNTYIILENIKNNSQQLENNSKQLKDITILMNSFFYYLDNILFTLSIKNQDFVYEYNVPIITSKYDK